MYPHFIIGGYFKFLQIRSVIFAHILVCVQGDLEEIREFILFAYLSKYVKYRIDLVMWNEVPLDNCGLVTNDVPKYCLTRRDTYLMCAR
jgi:hypothetical protein